MSQSDPEPSPSPGDDGAAEKIDPGPMPSQARPEWITFIERDGTPVTTEKHR